MKAVLGVENSLNSLAWVQKEVSEDIVLAIARQCSLPPALARVLAARDVSPEQAKHFLNPSFKALMPDPYTLKDMQKATERLAMAVFNKETIAVFGDYDVDGATSSSVLTRYLQRVCKNKVIVRIPERDEGYGPTKEAMEAFIGQGASLIVTVDCGTTAFEALEPFNGKTDIIVVDHHEPEITLPKVCALVNPKRLDEPEDNPCRSLAAVGVVFLLVVALNRHLREKGWFTAENPEPDIRLLLDLVALGTVCDVVRLRGVNRMFVKSGLMYLGRRQNKGLSVLSDLAGVKDRLSSYELGYFLGPRLNACGRIGKADLGFRLLCAKTEAEAREIAEKLDELNALRRDMCTQALQEAVEMVETKETLKPFIFVCSKEWHSGIVGIIAGRLKDRYNLPALVMTQDKDMVHGSARSVSGFNLGEAVLAAVEKGVLERGGGHAMAAGFSLKPEKLADFEDFLAQYIETHTDTEKQGESTYLVDGLLDVGAVSADFVEKIACLEPFGEGNPEPRFVVPNVGVSYVKVLKGGHISCTLKGHSGKTLRAIAFKAADSSLGQVLLKNQGELMHFAGCVREDSYYGNGRAQFIIEDAALAE